MKDFIPEDSYFSKRMIPKMIQNLKTLYQQKICVFDIKEDNYRNGVLVGLSQAWTLPYLMLDPSSGLRPEEDIHGDIESPAAYFNGMIDDWNEYGTGTDQVWVRFLPNNLYRVRLRKRTRSDVKTAAELWGKIQRSAR